VRDRALPTHNRVDFSVQTLVADAAAAAALQAQATGCVLTVTPVAADIEVSADREQILAAIANLLHNAIKFTTPGSEVSLGASAYGSQVHIDVGDHCGGLPHGSIERMFTPFMQASTDRTGLGLGLAIARDSVEQDGGTLTVRDVPGTGCIFTLSLPRKRSEDRIEG
jgi:signal transduction histidine kinase